MRKIISLLCLIILAALSSDIAAQEDVKNHSESNRIAYRPIFRWKHLDWKFLTAEMREEYYRKEYFKTAMPAGVKVDAAGNFYVSVPALAARHPGDFE